MRLLPTVRATGPSFRPDPSTAALVLRLLANRRLRPRAVGLERLSAAAGLLAMRLFLREGRFVSEFFRGTVAMRLAAGLGIVAAARLIASQRVVRALLGCAARPLVRTRLFRCPLPRRCGSERLDRK